MKCENVQREQQGVYRTTLQYAMYQPQDFEKCYIFMTAVIKDYNLKVHFPSLDIHVFNFSMFCQLQGKKLRVKYEL